MGKHVIVVVMGDIGRSPRMQLHAVSLAAAGWSVDLVGYGGSMPLPQIASDKGICLKYMSEAPRLSTFPVSLAFLLRLLWQMVTLLVTLSFCKRPQFMVIQNPPSIPAVPVCWLFSKICGSKLVIDWHNYMHTILSLKYGDSSFVKMCKKIDFYFGLKADANFCVTNCMREDLKRNGITAVTFHDRPGSQFSALSVEEQHNLWISLKNEYPVFDSDTSGDKSTRFTSAQNETSICCLLRKRPALLVSSTSWTEDEDFQMLIDALVTLENSIASASDLPNVIMVVTGKGPLKAYYSNLISKLHFKHVQFCFPWLEPSDYPKMLASANIGISLHTSSSGLDLPMKVVDMFGARLPVLALRFPCIGELVREAENGFTFQTADNLADLLHQLLQNFPDNEKLNVLKQNLIEKPLQLWQPTWNTVVLPVIEMLI